MKKTAIIVCLAAIMSACGGAKKQSRSIESPAEQSTVTISLDGAWKLTSYISGNDTVRIDSDTDYLLTFSEKDSVFGLTTDCNSLGGMYLANGDSLKFGNIFANLMLCEQMEVEDAMKAMLPAVSGYNVSNDSVLTLKSAEGAIATFSRVTVDDKSLPE